MSVTPSIYLMTVLFLNDKNIISCDNQLLERERNCSQEIGAENGQDRHALDVDKGQHKEE